MLPIILLLKLAPLRRGLVRLTIFKLQSNFYKRPCALGKSCHIWQFLKVSIELRTLAVLWTLFCVDRTADLSSFMDTFSMFKKLPDLGSFMDTFQTQ